MKKDLLISHVDLDGISPNILMNLTNRKYDAYNIDIKDIDDTFDKIFSDDSYKKYEHIYICDLTLTKYALSIIDNLKLDNVKLFDHHESGLFVNEYPFATVKIDINGIQTCGTELFYLYLKDIYINIDTKSVNEYVRLVRELDTYNFTDDTAKQLDSLRATYGKEKFIKLMSSRLKRNSDIFKFSSFENRLIKIREDEKQRYLEVKEKQMKKYTINSHNVGIVYAERHKSELGNYLSTKYPELDFIIIIDVSSGISYRTSRNDQDLAVFAQEHLGGGHKKASGSPITDEMRDYFTKYYFKDAKELEDNNI